MRQLILEFDDFHWKDPENCLESVRFLVNRYPNIKLSFFTSANYQGFPLSQNQTWVDEVKQFIQSNNIKLVVHGYNHSPEEFKHVTFEQAKEKLLSAHAEFEKSSLPFSKVFRGPHWGINNNTYDALIDLEYKAVYTHEDYFTLSMKYRHLINNFIYNWNLKDAFPPNDEVLIAHGHTHNVCENGIQQIMHHICNFLDNNDVEFKFVDEI